MNNKDNKKIDPADTNPRDGGLDIEQPNPDDQEDYKKYHRKVNPY